MRSLYAISLVGIVLLFDQVLKIWIKLTMTINQHEAILGISEMGQLRFAENNGMAFGLVLGEGPWAKFALTIFRIIAVIALGVVIKRLANSKASFLMITCVSLILAGALGNIIDSVFYGVIFSESTTTTVAELFPEGGGYSGYLQGMVVDMFYFPLITGYFPNWLPFWGGEHFIFFRPIFNVADSSISIGIALIFLFRNRLFPEKQEEIQE